jgi:hypothetical protein
MRMPAPAPSERPHLRAAELADTEEQLSDEVERVLRRLGLGWYDFAQYDRYKPWVRKPWHRQYGGWRPGQEALVHVRRPWTVDDERFTVTRLPEWSGRKKWRARNTGKEGPGRPKLALVEFAVLTVRQEIADRMNGYKLEDARLGRRGRVPESARPARAQLAEALVTLDAGGNRRRTVMAAALGVSIDTVDRLIAAEMT